MPTDLSIILEHLDNRKTELNEATNLISLLTTSLDNVVQEMVNSFSETQEPRNEKEYENILEAVNSHVKNMLGLTSAYRKATEEEQLLSKLQLSVASGFTRDPMGTILATMSRGKDSLLTENNALTAKLNTHLSIGQSALTTLRNVITDNKSALTNLVPSLTESIIKIDPKISTLFLKINSLRNRLDAGDFSKGRISFIINLISEMKDLLDTPSGVGMFTDPSLQGLTSASETLKNNILALAEKQLALSNLPHSLPKVLSTGMIYKKLLDSVISDFGSITSSFTGMRTNLTTNPIKTVQHMQVIMGKIASIQGILQKMSDKKMKQIPTDILNFPQITDLATSLGNLNSPLESLNTFNKTLRIANKLVSRSLLGKIPSLKVLDLVSDRMINSAAEVTSFLDTSKSIWNNFVAPISSAAQAVTNVIASVSSIAFDSLASGAVEEFSQTLANPILMSSAGKGAAKLITFIKENKENMTDSERGMSSRLLSYLLGQHKKYVISTHLSDPDLRRSNSLQNIEQFVKQYINPLGQTTKILMQVIK